MKAINPSRFYLSLICLVCLCFFASLLNNENYKSTTVTTKRAQGIDFPESYLESDNLRKSVPFRNKDFVDKKLLQLVSFTHLASQSDALEIKAHSKMEKATHEENISRSDLTDFSYMLDELICAVHLKNFLSQLWGCKETDLIKIEHILYETKRSVVWSGVYGNKVMQVEVAQSNLDILTNAKCGLSDSDRTQQNLDRCFLLKNRKLLDEVALLTQLSHPNIAQILGLCMQRVSFVDKSVSMTSSPGIVLMKETGSLVSLERLKMLNWNDRLEICLNMLNLAMYFANTPMRSLRLESWKPENFIMLDDSKKIQLNTLDQLIYLQEPSCVSDSHCSIASIDLGINCILGRCIGYNAKKNLFALHDEFLLPLLQHNTPHKLSGAVFDISIALNNPEIDATALARNFQQLLLQALSEILMEPAIGQHEDSKRNPSVVKVENLLDSWQVKSWERHENEIAINEVDFSSETDKLDQMSFNSIGLHEDLQSLDYVRNEQAGDGFVKYENADFPARYDYKCRNSRANWGCAISLRTVEEAMQACLSDVRCKAFVLLPHQRKEGWYIAILKSDSSYPVDHAGTTVYIHQSTGDTSLMKILPLDTAVEVQEQENCLYPVMVSQAEQRALKEEALMKSCGWSGMTDDDWTDLVDRSAVTGANRFKPANGRIAKGGQINIVLKSNFQDFPALFLAKRGPSELDVAQSAVYQLDRMLGLYKTIPALERQLSPTQLEDAGFPVDVGGNRFDHFRSLKQPDGSLIGVVVPQVSRRVVTEHHVTVPALPAITNAVTPFSERQWDDLEYLLLGFLAAIPTPSKGHKKIQGQLLHLKTEQAFRPNSNNYISYLYNCQFPSDVIGTLRHAYAHRCGLGRTIRTRLSDSHLTRIANIFQTNVVQLLDLVDKCVMRFGRQVVFYDAWVV